jgi:1,4-dihydroxy-2-naphthoate octaprenyltransferase
MKILPSRSALLHLRFPFSLFLLPVYVFALSQVPFANTFNCIVVFISWHFFIYPASNGYNSYFDKDEGSIALLKHPPKVDKSLYTISLFVELIGILIAYFAGWQFVLSIIIYGILSKMYSYPGIRLKKYPLISFFVVFVFQGAFVYWTSYAAMSRLDLFYGWDVDFILAGLICSCLIGASYPLTQVYQHEEDSKRGDKTLSILLGIKGTFYLSAILFVSGIFFLFIYWNKLGQLSSFYFFIAFCIPVGLVFVRWFIKVIKDQTQANFKNMSNMMFTSSISMLLYFLWIWLSQI